MTTCTLVPGMCFVRVHDSGIKFKMLTKSCSHRGIRCCDREWCCTNPKDARSRSSKSYLTVQTPADDKKIIIVRPIR